MTLSGKKLNKKVDKKFSYPDYLSWPDDERWEKRPDPKLLLYEKHGIKEYWIVNPDARYVMIYRLEGVRYDKPEYLTENDIIESRVLEGLRIDLRELWA